MILRLSTTCETSVIVKSETFFSLIGSLFNQRKTVQTWLDPKDVPWKLNHGRGKSRLHLATPTLYSWLGRNSTSENKRKSRSELVSGKSGNPSDSFLNFVPLTYLKPMSPLRLEYKRTRLIRRSQEHKNQFCFSRMNSFLWTLFLEG